MIMNLENWPSSPDASDIADPSSTQDVCHIIMNLEKWPSSLRVL